MKKGNIVPKCQFCTQLTLPNMTSEFEILRERANLSFEEVANLTGYTPRTIYRWANGEITPRKAVWDLMSRIAASNEAKKTKADKHDFTFIDLFAGIGGIRKGFEASGGRCVFTSEWDKYARQTYMANFGCDHAVAGDITKVPVEEIPYHDVLLAGFPCQPFSIAGVSKKNALGRKHGFEDKAQGTLFFDVARIIEKHRPHAFLLENVKNLKSHDQGNTFRIIIDILENELGYKVWHHVIDAKGFVPQHRERIYLVGFKEDCGFDWNQVVIKSPADGPMLDSILHPEDGSESSEAPYTYGKTGKVSPQYTLTPKLWTYLKEYAAKHKQKGNGFGYGLVGRSDSARTLSARYYKDGSEILVRQTGRRPRRLTPRECSRLMGFDGPGESNFIIPVSDTQSYKQFGNSVVVPVIKEIARAMKPHVMKAKKKSVTRHHHSELV